jgi:predicted amidophosphoribosyltransferase
MEKILRWFRACANCGTNIPPIDGFCGRCFNEIIFAIQSDAHVVGGHPFAVHSLLKWTDDREAVGRLIKCLKGPHSKYAFKKLAGEVLRRASFKDKILIVPPSKREKFDHAWNFGEALGEFSGAELLSPFLIQNEELEQKRLNKMERSTLTFALSKQVKWRAKHGGFVFVDDLITTGATARAAWNALGRPTRFSAWTVACRPLRNQL